MYEIPILAFQVNFQRLQNPWKCAKTFQVYKAGNADKARGLITNNLA